MTILRNTFFKTVVPVALFLSLLVSCDQRPEAVEEKVVRPVRYYEIKAQEAGENRSFSGMAVAGRESSLSFKVSGTVSNLTVKVGDSVTKGVLLAEIDKTDLLVDLEAAKANLKSTEADTQAVITKRNTTRSNYSRIEKLYESNNVSLSEFEQARGDYDTAKAQLDAAGSQVKTAKIKLQAAENQLGYTEILAPFDGVVNAIFLEENEEISPGVSVLTLSGFDDLEVRINLSDLYISKLKKGQGCKILFPALSNESFEGVVTEIPYATSDAPTYPVKIRIQSGDRDLRPGMSAEVFFDFNEHKGDLQLYLQPDSVGEDSEGNFIFLLQEIQNGFAVASKQKVTLGQLDDKGFLVMGGVKQGDLVASSGLQILLDGMEVKLLDDPVKDW